MPVFPPYAKQEFMMSPMSFQLANARLFNIERNQDSGGQPSNSSISAIIQKVDVKTLSSDNVVPEFEKEIVLSNILISQAVEVIHEWNMKTTRCNMNYMNQI